MHLQDALGLIAFELLSVQPLLAWAFQPLPGVQGSLEPTILDAGLTPLESLEFIFRGGDWGQGMGTTGHRGSRGPCKYRFYSSLGLGRGDLLGNTGARGPGTFQTLASQKVGVSEGLTQHKVATMSSQMAMDLACQDFSSKRTATTSPFQSNFNTRALVKGCRIPGFPTVPPASPACIGLQRRACTFQRRYLCVSASHAPGTWPCRGRIFMREPPSAYL